jgi:predicted NUDIX family phosphoesterase
MDEEVLVFPSRLLGELGSFCGFSDRVDHYLPTLLDPAHLSFLPRSQAENDPTHKQLIPYVVLRCGEQVFCYTRGKRGSENRLHNLWSLGVGGHVAREDGVAGRAAYDVGYARELAEEVHIETTYEDRIIGLVHDDRTPVGAVHFGIVHVVDLAAPAVRHRDLALAEARFRSLDEVQQEKDRFESWSALVIEHALGSNVLS